MKKQLMAFLLLPSIGEANTHKPVLRPDPRHVASRLRAVAALKKNKIVTSKQTRKVDAKDLPDFHSAPREKSQKVPCYLQKKVKITLQLLHQVLGKDLPFLPGALQAVGNPNKPQALLPVGGKTDIFIDAVKIGNKVTLAIPSIGLTIAANAGPCFVYTVANFLPKEFRPTSATPVSFAVSSHLTNNTPFNDFPKTGDYEGYVNRFGVIHFSLPGGFLIPVGKNGAQFITQPASVSYTVGPEAKPLDNFVIATWGASNADFVKVNNGNGIFTPVNLLEFTEYNAIGFAGGRLVTSWADNSHTPKSTKGDEFSQTLNLAFSRIDIKTKNDKIKLKKIVCPHYIAPSAKQYQSEPSLAISAVDNNLIATSSAKFPPNITLQPPLNHGSVLALSKDGGKSFSVTTLGAFGGKFPIGFGPDATLVWDRFKNLWFYYVGIAEDTGIIFATLIASPGGDPKKFRVIQNVKAVIPAAQPIGLDYPWMAAGPDVRKTGAIDGGRPEAIWTIINQVTPVTNFTGIDSSAPALVYGIRVNGPLPDDPKAPLDGIISVPKQYLLESGNVGGQQSIAVGPKGDVLITYISGMNGMLINSSAGPNETIFSNYNPKGLDGTFSHRSNIAIVNMGNFEAVGPQPFRLSSVWPRAVADRSNSPFNGRFYVSYVDQKAVH
jgi:hypothetical protein